MVTTANPEWAAAIKTHALHGLSSDAWRRYSDSGFRQMAAHTLAILVSFSTAASSSVVNVPGPLVRRAFRESGPRWEVFWRVRPVSADLAVIGPAPSVPPDGCTPTQEESGDALPSLLVHPSAAGGRGLYRRFERLGRPPGGGVGGSGGDRYTETYPFYMKLCAPRDAYVGPTATRPLQHAPSPAGDRVLG